MVVIGVFVLCGCVKSNAVPCADGRVCPEGTTCDDAHMLCVPDQQREVCNGVADGEPCEFAGQPGLCDLGVCLPASCGNGETAGLEVCDDGNTISGDGCRADCLKEEVCGDGEVDANEDCDDGNANGADSCDACVETEWVTSVKIGVGSATATTTAAPAAIAFDGSGNLYVAERARVLRIDADGNASVVAGIGVPGFGGDGGKATDALISEDPAGLAVDGLGNIYLGDTRNHRVRKIDSSGVITTIAGNGLGGFSGDRGPATVAQINMPNGIAIDGLGNMLIADRFNNRIRHIDVSGIITTVAGTGQSTFSGDGGLAVAAALNGPTSVSLAGAGAFYIADASNNRVRKVQNEIITTVAGNGTGAAVDGGPATASGFAFLRGVAAGIANDFYIADQQNDRVRRVDSAGTVTTVAGTGVRGYSGDGGLATTATINQPFTLTVDTSGALVFADTQNHRIRRVSAAGIISTIAGTGSRLPVNNAGAATSTKLGNLVSVVVDAAGNRFFSEQAECRVRRIDPAGILHHVGGTTCGYGGDNGPATAAQLQAPTGLALDGQGRLLIADFTNLRVRRIDANGVITTVAGDGTLGTSGDGGAATAAQLSSPIDVARSPTGFFISEAGASRIRHVDAAGTITTVAGNGTSGFSGDGGAATAAQLSTAGGIGSNAAGNLYIADFITQRVRKVDTAGIITTIAGTGTSGFSGDGGPAINAQFAAPRDIAVDANGNLYIPDAGNRRLRRIDPQGNISTFAGSSGAFARDGDGAAATSASMLSVLSVATGGTDVYMTDSGDIRRIDANGIITTIGGAIDPPTIGPLALATLVSPKALVIAQAFTIFAGGTSGTVQLARNASAVLEVVAGRYPQATAAGNRARFRDQTFGTVGGVAYDSANSLMFLTESSANRIHVVTMVNPDDEGTWTIAPLANAAGTAGFANGTASSAQFREPAGLYYDAAAKQLYVADSGNHVIRVINLAAGVGSATVATAVGTPEVRGFFGDGGLADDALLFEPRALTRCGAEMFVADTGNNRIRRVEAGGRITTVLGDGSAALSGEGAPSFAFSVNAPLGLACDPTGNLFVTSSSAVRLLPVNDSGAVDGLGEVQTIYGLPPRDTFPANATRCLSGLAVVDATAIQVVDACAGLLIELRRQPRP